MRQEETENATGSLGEVSATTTGAGVTAGGGMNTIGGGTSGGPLTGGLPSMTTGNATPRSTTGEVGLPGATDAAPGNPAQTDPGITGGGPTGGGKAVPDGIALPQGSALDGGDSLDDGGGMGNQGTSGVSAADAGAPDDRAPAIRADASASGEEDGAPTGGLRG